MNLSHTQTPPARTAMEQPTLVNHVERLLEIEHSIWEALATARISVDMADGSNDMADIMMGLERASTEAEAIKSALMTNMPQQKHAALTASRIGSSIYRVVYSACHGYYASPWLPIDLPNSVNPFTMVVHRPAELMYCIMAYLCFQSEAYMWCLGCVGVALLSSYQTTALRQCVVDGQVSEHPLTSIIALVVFRLCVVQSSVYIISQAHEKSIAYNVGNYIHIGNPWSWTWSELLKYYNSTSATILAILVGVLLGF